MLRERSGGCEDVGYYLEYHTASFPAGFALSFAQAPQPRLHHLSYSYNTRPNHVSRDWAMAETTFAELPHWQSPELEPVAPEYSSVSASSLLPTYSTTTEFAFHTVTTPVLQATPTREGLAVAITSTFEADLPKETSVTESVPVSYQEHHEHDKNCLVDTIKSVALRLQSGTRSAFQMVLGLAGHYKPLHMMETSPGAGQSRNHTRGATTFGANRTGTTTEDEQLELPSVDDDQAVRALRITSFVVIIVGCTCCFLVCLRRDPRRRADQAARREERRNRRLYRRAACKHRWQSFIARIRGQDTYQSQSQTFSGSRSAEAESVWREKFAQSTTAGVASHASSIMREELDSFRKAHGLVSGLVRTAERDQGGTKRSAVARHTRSYSDSLNSEKSWLPAYTEKDEVVVIDGQLRSSRALRDLTPASSIIATSPVTSDCGSSDSEKE